MRRILIIASGMPASHEREMMAAAFSAQEIALTWRDIAVPTNSTGTACDAAVEDLGILRSGMDAAEEGFDAVCVDTMNDIGTVALRSVLDIPVLGTIHAAVLHALTLGVRFSLIVSAQAAVAHCRGSIRQWGLERQCSSVRAVAETGLSFRDGLHEAARQCVMQDGADVVCLGSSMMAPAANALAQALGVPVVEPLASSCRLAETLLALGLRHSRTAHPKPLVAKPGVFRAMAEAGITHTNPNPY
jgi:allantoin racemase